MKLFNFKNEDDFRILINEISRTMNLNKNEVEIFFLKNRKVNSSSELFYSENFFSINSEFQDVEKFNVFGVDNDAIHFEISFFKGDSSDDSISKKVSSLLTGYPELIEFTSIKNLDIDGYILVKGSVSFQEIRKRDSKFIIEKINNIYKKSGVSKIIDAFYIQYDQDKELKWNDDKINSYCNHLNKKYFYDIYEFFIDNIELKENLNSSNFTKYYIESFI